MTSHNDTYWFVPKWLGQTIHFENPSSSWKVIQKLQEHTSRFSQDEYVFSGFYSESTCIFICEEIKDSMQAIMKVRMQIPNRPEDKPLYPRCSQPPEKEMCGRTLLEVRALEALTLATCSCTPKYITSKHGNQVSDGWVPDGLLDYIVMQRVEGISLPRKYLRDLGPMEQDEIRKAFKASYQECQKYGFVNLSNDLSNIIWNGQKPKCYIVDWETWSRRTYEWNDNEFRWWGLQSISAQKSKGSQNLRVIPVSIPLISNSKPHYTYS